MLREEWQTTVTFPSGLQLHKAQWNANVKPLTKLLSATYSGLQASIVIRRKTLRDTWQHFQESRPYSIRRAALTRATRRFHPRRRHSSNLKVVQGYILIASFPLTAKQQQLLSNAIFPSHSIGERNKFSSIPFPFYSVPPPRWPRSTHIWRHDEWSRRRSVPCESASGDTPWHENSCRVSQRGCPSGSSANRLNSFLCKWSPLEVWGLICSLVQPEP
jgi:hypothetical protein